MVSMPSTSHSDDLARRRCTCWARWSSAEVGSSISLTLAFECWSLNCLTMAEKAPVVSLPMHQLMLPLGLFASLSESVLSLPPPPAEPPPPPPPQAVRATTLSATEARSRDRRKGIAGSSCPGDTGLPALPSANERAIGKRPHFDGRAPPRHPSRPQAELVEGD